MLGRLPVDTIGSHSLEIFQVVFYLEVKDMFHQKSLVSVEGILQGTC